ncbi:MAG: hypothetical protein GU346_05590 [Thermocrinis sp.]|jgi:hypothetical protein|nr:hypothetical protein [Thermocrinis sp.]
MVKSTTYDVKEAIINMIINDCVRKKGRIYMKKPKIFWILLVFVLFILPKQGYSEEKNPIIIVEIKNGINYFDIDNDGVKDLIISADFLTPIGGNIYTAYSFYLNHTVEKQKHFSYIPIEVDDGKGAEASIYTYAKVGGCGYDMSKEETNISGLRLVKFKNDIYLIYTKKKCSKNKNTFTDKCPFSIVLYQYDSEDKTFVIKKKSQTEKIYCDADEVLKKDLITELLKY